MRTGPEHVVDCENKHPGEAEHSDEPKQNDARHCAGNAQTQSAPRDHDKRAPSQSAAAALAAVTPAPLPESARLRAPRRGACGGNCRR